MPTLAELGARLGVTWRGPDDTRLEGVATLAGAGPGQLAFLANRAYRRELAGTRAAAVVLAPEDADACPVPVLISDRPYATFAAAARLLVPPPAPRRGVHATAVIDPSARVDETAWIGPHSVVEPGARVGARCQIGPGCLLGEGVTLGDDCRLLARVTLMTGTRLGARVTIQPGAVIGGDGFGMAWTGERWLPVPQLGGVVIGDDVDIGANTTIDRGTLEDTRIGDGVKIDNQVQIAHNVVIGEHTAIAGCVGISGSVRIGRRCALAGGVGVVGHLEIADDVEVTAMSMVTRSLRRPGSYSSGTPLMPRRNWRRNSVRLRHLDELARRLRRLERALRPK